MSRVGGSRATPTAVFMQGGALTPRVVTYNVLSSSLTGDFHACDPQDLKPAVRLKRVLGKLRPHVDDGAVICLQEVSVSWAGPLHAMFAQKGYHFVLDLYGNVWSGFMGVGMAFPTDRYDVVNVDIQKLADTKYWPKPKPLSFLQKLTANVVKLWRKVTRTKPPEDPWRVARYRKNGVIHCALRCKTSEEQFSVVTYHMPCLYKNPPVMTIHAALLVQYAERMSKGRPFIIAGDLNIKPRDSAYGLFTKGSMAADDPEYPQPPPGEEWRPVISSPLRSAYAQYLGQEPEFTNNAKFGENPQFIDTLDYIFLSNHWETVGVHNLPARSSISAPQPTAREPSDHLLLGCTIRLRSDSEITASQ